MNIYKYETHMHCSESSGCAHNTGAEMADYYKRLGYTGIIVTDHVFPNARFAESQASLDAFVDRISAGYRACKARGDEIGLDVFPGWEYGAGHTHLLIYGLNHSWHRDNPESMTWDAATYLDRVRADGAFIVHAHPFREGTEPVRLFPSRTDAVEVLNASHTEAPDRRAEAYAEMYGLAHSAGSDCHWVDAKRLCGVSSESRLASINDFINSIKSGGGTIFDDKF